MPTIHIHDLANVIIRVAHVKPNEGYILAVDNSNSTLKEIVQAISTTLGSGEVKQYSKEEALLLPDINQIIIDSLTINLKTEPILINEIDLSWTFEVIVLNT